MVVLQLLDSDAYSAAAAADDHIVVAVEGQYRRMRSEDCSTGGLQTAGMAMADTD